MAVAILLILLGAWLILQALGGNLAAKLLGQA